MQGVALVEAARLGWHQAGAGLDHIELLREVVQHLVVLRDLGRDPGMELLARKWADLALDQELLLPLVVLRHLSLAGSAEKLPVHICFFCLLHRNQYIGAKMR